MKKCTKIILGKILYKNLLVGDNLCMYYEPLCCMYQNTEKFELLITLEIFVNVHFCHVKAFCILHGKNLHHPLYLSMNWERVTKAGSTAERCYNIIWVGGDVGTQISNKVKLDLENQMSDKYHRKSNKQIEKRYFECNHVQQEKWKSKTLIFKVTRRFLVLACICVMQEIMH